MSIAEVLFAVTGNEFAFKEAPESMKAVMTSVWLLTEAVGNILIIIITRLCVNISQVIESAQQRVKEDQMRKEIEIVKKSLEELKEKEATPPIRSPAPVDISKNLSSASDLLALVHASIQSKAPISVPSAISTHTSDIVVNSTQPRSFGDLPASIESLIKPQNTSIPTVVATVNPAPMLLDEPICQSPMGNINEPFNQQNETIRPPSNNNFSNEPYNQNHNNQNDNYNQVDSYNQSNIYNQSDSYNQHQPYDQSSSYGQAAPYNQNEQYHQNGTFVQNQPINQNQPFIQPWNNPRPSMPDNRGQMNQGYNDFNQGGQVIPNHGNQNQFQPRGNFPNANNMNKNQYGNLNSGNNFRGRGRGNFNGGSRGRGRGRY